MRANVINYDEQCQAARTIRERYGLQAAFDYAVGEKLMNFASAASEHPAFAGSFLDLSRKYDVCFRPMKSAAISRDSNASRSKETRGIVRRTRMSSNYESKAQGSQRIRQFATIKDLLTTETLGTS